MASRPSKWRVLAVTAGVDLPTNGEYTASGAGPLQEFADPAWNEAEVEVLTDSAVVGLGAKIASWMPNMVYISAGASPSLPGSSSTLNSLSLQTAQGVPASLDAATLAGLLAGQDVDTVYLQSFASRAHADALREQGVAHVVYYDAAKTPDPNSHYVQHFSHAFFATLRNKSATVPEAFAMAMHSCHAHCGPVQAPPQHPSWLPELISDFDPLLPSIDSVPLPVVKGSDFKTGVARAVPGWENVRLLAPHAELRLLACGQSSLVDAQRLSYLGEALRALLVLEVRQLRLAGRHPCERTPAHLPQGATASRCSVQTASGAHATVVLGGPPNVLEKDSLVEYALRQTLVADAVSLQFRLPPPGVPAPVPRRSSAIAGGTPVVDTLVITSVWAVHLLRSLSQEKLNRTLVALGIGAVGGSAVTAFEQKDAARYSALTAAVEAAAAKPSQQAGGGPGQQPNGTHPPGPDSHPAMQPGVSSEQRKEQPAGLHQNGHAPAAKAPPAPAGGARAAEALSDASPGRKRKVDGSAEPFTSRRPRLTECSEEEFLQDVCAFHRSRGVKNVSPDNFPDAILNGRRLDVYNLYREVTTRGGFRVGNGINWKGQIFPQLNNFTAHNRMTGVGNALKRHYTLYLLEYELAHPEDMLGDTCALCARGDEQATDWVCCDRCGSWRHFSCDTRPGLGAFKDYSKGKGATYICFKCAGEDA
ncbi:hypothetical protein CVIRNUC_009518 [Coccomyxa viridis]|uniref:ARID domain-containing protein n=1 Tax=Coccomyxa viridis TaxID=1274662 RepID=A0AAV1IJV4_9CHLO|nr:hypothetical protein CVIRNUC_009518 [Coccomyxa viridis]